MEEISSLEICKIPGIAVGNLAVGYSREFTNKNSRFQTSRALLHKYLFARLFTQATKMCIVVICKHRAFTF